MDARGEVAGFRKKANFLSESTTVYWGFRKIAGRYHNVGMTVVTVVAGIRVTPGILTIYYSPIPWYDGLDGGDCITLYGTHRPCTMDHGSYTDNLCHPQQYQGSCKNNHTQTLLCFSWFSLNVVGEINCKLVCKCEEGEMAQWGAFLLEGRSRWWRRGE